MNGLSYYPVDIGSENITLQYANVKFYNADIEEKEAGNKLTREETQHYTMHCALFHDFEVESTSSDVTYTLTVNGVSFDGTVGVVNGGSGALICGKVEGLNNGTNAAICKVVLADEDNRTKAVKLSGISVDSTADYCPVLINSFADYSALEANYIITEQETKAGSSLFGKVEKQTAEGSVAAVNVSIVLEGTIKLNETKDAVFTRLPCSTPCIFRMVLPATISTKAKTTMVPTNTSIIRQPTETSWLMVCLQNMPDFWATIWMVVKYQLTVLLHTFPMLPTPRQPRRMPTSWRTTGMRWLSTCVSMT